HVQARAGERRLGEVIGQRCHHRAVAAVERPQSERRSQIGQRHSVLHTHLSPEPHRCPVAYNPPEGLRHPPPAPAHRDGDDPRADVMTYPAALHAGTAPGLTDLPAAAETLRDCAMQYLNLSPQHWQSPAADAYRKRVKDLSDAVQSTAGQV